MNNYIQTFVYSFIFCLVLSSCQKPNSNPAEDQQKTNVLSESDVTNLYAQISCGRNTKKGYYVLANDSKNLIVQKINQLTTATTIHLFLMKDGIYSARITNYVVDESNMRRVRINFQTWVDGNWSRPAKNNDDPENIIYKIELKDLGLLSIVNENSQGAGYIKKNQLTFAADLRGLNLKGRSTYIARTFISKGPQNQNIEDLCEQ